MQNISITIRLVTIVVTGFLFAGCKSPQITWSSDEGIGIGFRTRTHTKSQRGTAIEAHKGESSLAPAALPTPRALTSGTPVPIGPPAPGRLNVVPMQWSHNPAEDGTTEYRLYWGTVEGQWQGMIAVSATNGTQYTYSTRARGPHWWTVTAARPPIREQGETEYQESDPSNVLRVNITGIPASPDRLRTPPDSAP